MEGLMQEFLLNLALAALTLLSSYALYYIRKAVKKVSAETAKIQNEDQRSLVQAAIQRLDDVATKTVQTIEQTTAKELRRAVKNGEADKSDLIDLSKRAYREIVRTLEPEYVQALQGTLGDLDTYIQNTVESKVLELKKSTVLSEALEYREGV